MRCRQTTIQRVARALTQRGGRLAKIGLCHSHSTFATRPIAFGKLTMIGARACNSTTWPLAMRLQPKCAGQPLPHELDLGEYATAIHMVKRSEELKGFGGPNTSFHQGIRFPANTGLTHATPVLIGVVAGATVDQCTIIPDRQFAHLPAVLVNMLSARRFFLQPFDQCPAVIKFPAIDVPAMSADEKISCAGTGISSYQPLTHGR